MIVTFDEDHVKTQSGKDIENGVVYCSYKNDTICYTRKYVKPKTTAHNREYGAKLKKISLLYKTIPDTFKDSLKVYAQAYNQQLLPAKKAPLNAFNIFVKALCCRKVSLKDLDSIENIVHLFGGCIDKWINNGLLEKIKTKILDVDILPAILPDTTILENIVNISKDNTLFTQGYIFNKIESHSTPDYHFIGFG